MSCGVGLRCGLDPALLWLWCRPLAWEPPYAAGAALEETKKKKASQQKTNARVDVEKRESFFILFFNGRIHGIWKFPAQGLDLSHSYGNILSFNLLHQIGDQTHIPTSTQASAVLFLIHCAIVETPRP